MDLVDKTATQQAGQFSTSAHLTLAAGQTGDVGEFRHAHDEIIREMLSVLLRLRSVMANFPLPSYRASRSKISSEFSDLRMDSEEQYWQSNEGLTSERVFHGKLYYLVNALVASYQECDIDSMCDVVRRLLWVDEHVTAEPLQSVFITGLVHSLLTIARACIDHYQIEDGYKVAQRSAELLELKRRRRLEQGLAPRPDSECWYLLYELVAELKWKGPHTARDQFMTPEKLISDFLGVEQRCLNYLKQNPSSIVSRNQRVLDGLAWARLQLIKMASLWCPGLVEEMIEAFNEIHDRGLSSKVGHFERPHPGKRDDPWYWDHELFKWCVHGCAAPDEALLCHQWRLDAMRSKCGHYTCLMAFEQATNRELEYLLNPGHTQEVALVS